MSESCQNCRFWKEIDHAGVCRRYPPQMDIPVRNAFVESRSLNDKIAELMESTCADEFRFPITTSSEWCGEYQEAK